MSTLRTRMTGAAALLLAIAACSKDATGPTTISNPASAMASLNGVDSTFATPAFQSFLAVTGSFNGSPAAPFGHVGALLRATAPRIPGSSGAPNGPALGAALRTLAGVMASVEAILPDSLLGKTFVWDTIQAKYVVSADTGAPSNGIRFLLYEVDSTGNIGTPLTQVGRLDLIDKSTAGTQSLEVVVASNTFTYVDYTVSGSGTRSAFTLTAAGFIRNTRRELDFSITYSLSGSAYAIHEQFDDTADQLHLTFSFGITVTSDTSTAVTLGFTYQVGSQSIEISGGGAINALTESLAGSVKVNGNTFALITAIGIRGTPATVTDAHGNPLSADDRLLLLRMFDIVGHALGWLNYFVQPFVNLTVIGVLLSL
ncbi:MAG TPA: hypothetical protein VJN62_10835 [Gemmatimonadales bacterium]|nr:hypothetical protein [Gemmatimonadales bacterium]